MVTLDRSVEERCADLYTQLHRLAFGPEQRRTLARYAPPVLRSLGTGQRHERLDGDVFGYRRYAGYHDCFVGDRRVLRAIFHGGVAPDLSEADIRFVYAFQMGAVYENPDRTRLPFGMGGHFVNWDRRDGLKTVEYVGCHLGNGPHDHRWLEIVFAGHDLLLPAISDPEKFLRDNLDLPHWGQLAAFLEITFVTPDPIESRVDSDSDGGQDR